MKANSPSKNLHCLAFWILFALAKILEQALGLLFGRIHLLDFIKGIVILLLVIPDFSSAFFVYSSLVGTSTNETPFETSIKDQESNERDICINDDEETVPFTYFEGDEQGDSEKRKEWSCSICLISTTSEFSLNEHLNGERHTRKLRERTDGIAINHFLSYLVNKESWWEGIRNPLQRSIPLKWEKPGTGWTKLNTDGSVSRTSACIGGILRNSKGDPIRAFVTKIPHRDIFAVEMLAVWRGLVLARSLGVRAVWVESDAKSVVQTINQKQIYSGDAEKCLKLIWKLLRRFSRHQVTHLYREANRAADYLASMPTEKIDVVLSPKQFPGGLWKIIKEDGKGKVYHRKMGLRLPFIPAYG